MAQQTAVQWLLENIQKVHKMDWDIVFVQAMMMEKEQIMNAFENGIIAYNNQDRITDDIDNDSEFYYNQTYNK